MIFITAPERRSTYIDSMTGPILYSNTLFLRLKGTTKKGSDYFCVIGLMRKKKCVYSRIKRCWTATAETHLENKKKTKRSRFWLIIIKIQPILCGHKSISIHIYAGKWVHTIINNVNCTMYTHNTIHTGIGIGTIISIIFFISIGDWMKEKKQKERMIFYACKNNKLLRCHCP